MSSLSSPFGSWGPLVASVVAVAIVAAWVAMTILGRSEPALDNVALLVVGVVLGTGAVNGNATQAQAAATAAHARLDAMGAPPATGTPGA